MCVRSADANRSLVVHGGAECQTGSCAYPDGRGKRSNLTSSTAFTTQEWTDILEWPAPKAAATSGRNNTLVYLPSGTSGVPLVQDPQNVNRLRRP